MMFISKEDLYRSRPFFFTAFVTVFLLLLIPLSLFLVLNTQQTGKKAAERGNIITLTIDTKSSLESIKPIWRSSASWKPWVWVTTPMVQGTPPQDWFVKYFPFFESLRIMPALGGNTTPPSGQYCGTAFSCEVPEILKEDGSYDFSFLDKTLTNLKRAGVYPSLDLAQTPKVLALTPYKYCNGFRLISSSLQQNKVNNWKNLLTTLFDRYRGVYGTEIPLKWNFASFNEADTGNPNLDTCLSAENTDPSCCSFTGTEEQYVRDILLPTLEILKNKNLLANFHPGSFETIRQGSGSPKSDNDAISSDRYLTYLFSELSRNGYQSSDFKSFAYNVYGVYPDTNDPVYDGSIFDIKRHLEATRRLIRSKGYDLPLRSDELGIIHNYNSNTPVYDTNFAASWFASVFKIYLDLGNIDQVNSWWYLLVKNGRSFDPTKWQRNFAYYTFLMYHQLSNNQRLSVTGGIFDEGTLRVIDAVAGKDTGGIIKAVVFHHDDELSGAPTDTDPNAPIADRADRTINASFTNLDPGEYQFNIYRATEANIVSSPANLPIVDSKRITVSSSGIFQTAINLPHHSVAFLTLQPSFDQTISVEPRSNEVYLSWTTAIPTTSYIAYSDEPTGFDGVDPAGWGKWRYNIDNTGPEAMKTEHPRIKIGGLNPGTTYYFRVAGRDYPGNGILLMQLDVRAFMTTPLPITPTPTPTIAPVPTFAVPTVIPEAGDPSNLYVKCLATQAEIVWTAGAKAAFYSLRLDDLIDGWDGTCTSGDVCVDTPNTWYHYNFTPGHTYRWWMHSRNEIGDWGRAVAGNNFTCE